MGSDAADPVEAAYAKARATLETIEMDSKAVLAGFMLPPGGGFLEWICRYLQETLDVDLALVGEICGIQSADVHTLHMRGRDEYLDNIRYPLTDTAESTILDRERYECCAQASEVLPDLQVQLAGEMQSYVHIAIRDLDGRPLGVVAVIDHAPISEETASNTGAHLDVFRARLAAELIRRRAIRSLQLASSAALTSQASLEHLLLSLCQATQVRAAFVAEREVVTPVPGRATDCVLLTTLAFCQDGASVENATIDASGTILGEIYAPEGLLITDGLVERCPKTAAITPFESRSFAGLPFYGAEGEMLGQVVVLHDRVLPSSMLSGPLLRVLLARIAGELQRLDYEKRHDILYRRVLEAEHRDSIGSLASGVAHDFNNILFAVSGQAHLVDRIYADDSALREQMSVIIAACEQASGLCQQLMVFAGKQPSNPTALDLNEVVLGCQRIAGIFTKGKTSIVYRLAREPLTLRGSVTRLQQLVMNLLKNAADAIEPGGSIRVTTRTQECSQNDFDDAHLGENQAGGSYAVLEVSDDGPGIPASILRRIFTPFFSTKETNQGMGLTAVMGGAKEHGAAIFVKTSPLTGTCLQVYFPLAQAATSTATMDPITPAPAMAQGRPILVIDDDDLVRRTVARILGNEGFHVTCAASGKEGLLAAERMADSLSAVVLDYFMPQMRGDEVLVHLHELVPNVPVLLISGNVSSAQVDAFARPPRAFLSKPVLPKMLADTVRSMIQS